jgi:hypothetical protein
MNRGRGARRRQLTAYRRSQLRRRAISAFSRKARTLRAAF